jgi:hypothetical protein
MLPDQSPSHAVFVKANDRILKQKATGNPDWTNGVNFNIAHDEQLVVLGVHDYDASIEILPRAGHFVGVDCMRLDRPKDELVALDEVLMDQVSPSLLQ